MHPYLDDPFSISWSRLVPDSITPDIECSLQQARKNIESLCEAISPDDLTFENTMLALENATEQLTRAWGLVSHLDSVRNSDALREHYNSMLPIITQFYSSIPLNEKLWRRIKTYSETDEAKSLTGIRKRFLDETVAEFIRSGADLSAEKKKRLEEVQAALAQLTQKFSENVLDSTNAWELVLENDQRLSGLPETALAVLRADAESKGLGTKDHPFYRITLKAPSYIPILEYVEDEDLRREVWEATTTIGRGGEFDNTDLIRKILKLRQESAEILGKSQFADRVLEERMAKNGETALRFVEDLAEKTTPFFKREIEELRSFRKKSDSEWNGEFEPWNVAFWTEKLRKAEHDFDEEELRPYFSIDHVLDGMFRLAEHIFGLEIREREVVYGTPGDVLPADNPNAVEVWHPEVKFYELHDSESGEHLGSFYADWHPREDKRGGAWMNHLSTGEPATENSARKLHLGLICGNLTPSSSDGPALLTHREVETVFHEFGHLLHHLLGDVEIKSLNGIHVVWDFVELPSQIMENFCWSRKSLDFFARHYQTGEPIPEELFQKMLGARNFQSAMVQMRQLAFSKMDLELHINHHSTDEKVDLDELVFDILDGYIMPLTTRPPTMARRFTHLFSNATGYAAGYYSYKWAEVLDADAFNRFAIDGVVSPEVGREFREKILSKGGSKEAGELFRDFMDREPDLNALLERSGLTAC